MTTTINSRHAANIEKKAESVLIRYRMVEAESASGETIFALIPRDGSIGMRFVNLTTMNCTCEGFEKAQACSHLIAVRREVADRKRWEWEAREAEMADFLTA